jgi:hypothetical protein
LFVDLKIVDIVELKYADVIVQIALPAAVIMFAEFESMVLMTD